MKKIFLITTLFIFIFSNLSYAISSNELKNSIEKTYINLKWKLKPVYEKYENKYKIIKQKYSTGDYVILSNLTWLNLTGLKQNIDEKYTNFAKLLINEKYKLSAKVDDIQNKFDTKIISTGDYENWLKNLNIELSAYKTTYLDKIKLFDKELSGVVENFEDNIWNKLNFYKTSIEKIKTINSKIKLANDLYNNLLQKKEKLEWILWVSKKIALSKIDEIKKFVNKYFSDFVDKKFDYYNKKDNNFSYFEKWKDIKKQLILWFISDKIEKKVNSTINSYYPDINYDVFSKRIDEIKNISFEDKFKKFDEIDKKLSTFISDAKNANNELDKYISKFKSKENLLKILKQDVVKALEWTTKIVEDDIEQTFKSRFDFIKVKEKQEQKLVNLMSAYYEENINSDNINKLQWMIEVLNAYKNNLKLPENIKLADSFLNVVKDKIEQIKQREILDKINKLSQTIDNLPIWNNFDNINKLKKEIENLKVDNKLKNKIQILKMKLKINENLSKLFVSWAIRYYYTEGDLSYKVADILEKIKEKYVKKWKEKLFEEKLKNAEKKLEKLEENLKSDLKSYYFIMIHNWIIRFNMKKLNNE